MSKILIETLEFDEITIQILKMNNINTFQDLIDNYSNIRGISVKIKEQVYNKLFDSEIKNLEISTKLYNILKVNDINTINNLIQKKIKVPLKLKEEYESIILKFLEYDQKYIQANQTKMNAKLIEEIIVNSFKSNENTISLEEIIQKIPKTIYEEQSLINILKEKIENKTIIPLNKTPKYKKDFIFKYKPQETILLKNNISQENISILDDLKILNLKEKEIINQRLSGKTLKYIGQQYNISKERVRQIEKKIVLKLKNQNKSYNEDNLKYMYTLYNIPKDLIVSLSNELTLNYLQIFYKKGNQNIKYLNQDTKISIEIKHKVEQFLCKDYINLNDKYIKKDKNEILKYSLNLIAKQPIRYEHFEVKYNELIESLNLNKKYIINKSNENKILSSNYVIAGNNKLIRYYNVKKAENLLSEINLNQYLDLEISSYKLYEKNLQLMEQYNIKNEYELHNLLKKIDTNKKIKYGRMPMLEIGNCNRETQVLNLFKKNYPIKLINLAKEYLKQYGVKPQTFISNFTKCIEKYNKNGLYDINNDAKDDIPLEIIIFLTEDYYCLADLKEKLKVKFPSFDLKLINKINLNKLNYNINSNCIISKKYKSTKQYFEKILTDNMQFDITEISENIKKQNQFYTVLYEMKNEYQIIEYQQNKYINIKKINSINIKKEDLINYTNEIISKNKNKYFTVSSAKKQGFIHNLHNLGFENYFYSSLVSERKEIISTRKIKDNKIFTTEKIFNLQNFIIQTIKENNNKIAIDKLIIYLKEYYEIKISKNKILTIVQNTHLHYSNIFEKIYIDYDTYYKEI